MHKDKDQYQTTNSASQSGCTSEQLAVINARDQSLLVAASAGTGKTFTLTQRIISRVLDHKSPLDLERLLVVTFTDAAAKEMRDRIRRKLLEELEKDPDNTYLRLQVQKVGRAQISTIDSFFREIIRRYSYLLGLEPSPPVIDEAQAVVLRESVLDRVFEELYASDDPDFIDLVDCYGRGVNDGKLKQLVLRIFAYENSLPDIAQWEKNVLSLWEYDAETLQEHPWVEMIREAAIQELDSCKAKLNYCLFLCSQATGLSVYIPTLKEDVAAIEASMAVLRAGGWDTVVQSLPTYGRFKQTKSDPDLRKQIQEMRNAVKKTTKKLQEEWFGRSLAEYAADFSHDRRRVSTLLRIVSLFRREYTALKQRLGVVDFADLAHLSLAILTKDADGPYGGPAAYELRAQYDEVLIDEYQDTNQIQDYILALVSRDLVAEQEPGQTPNRIMIGDVKQSIYRFRLADPRIFRDKLATYSEHSGSKRKVSLSKNFRSRREILAATNFVFKQIMQSDLVELDYAPAEHLVFGAQWLHPTVDSNGAQIGGEEEPKEPQSAALITSDVVPIELYVLDKQAQGNGDAQADSIVSADEALEDGEDLSGDEALQNSFHREVQLIAQRIQELIADNTLVFDDESKKWRPVRYGDMAVLLRTAKDRSEVVAQILRAFGIPVVSLGKTDLFSCSEIKLLTSLLQVIDNPRRSPQLCMVLLSAIGGFTADEIALLRMGQRQGELYDSLLVPVSDSELERKRRGWLERLEKWREMAHWCGVSDFIRWLISDVGEGKLIQAAFDLPQRRENLKQFVALAESYEEHSVSNLAGFVRYLEELKSSGGYEITDNSIDIETDAVKIMTIHNSKGLEFPIVFLPDLGKGFNFQDAREDVLFQQELGIGLKHVDLMRKEKWPTLSSLAVSIADKKASLAEEMRILYVAMTRARERLILIGSANLSSAPQRWAMGIAQENELLPANLILEAKCVLDWLCPAIMRHRDGQGLREAAGYAYAPACVELFSHSSCWYVSVGASPATPGTKTVQIEQTDADTVNAVREKLGRLELLEEPRQDYSHLFDWEYPYRGLTKIKRVYAVTDLAESFPPAAVASAAEPDSSTSLWLEGTSLSVPRFALVGSQEATGAQRGLAVHKFIQLVDLEPELAEVSYVEQAIARLVRVGALSEEEARLVDPLIIARFFGTDLGRQFFAPGTRVEREIEFSTTLSTKAFLHNQIMQQHRAETQQPTADDLQYLAVERQGRGDFVIIRGIVDCILERTSDLVVIDFKTDRILPEHVLAYGERYRLQVRWYAKALEQIRDKPVSAMYLAFLTAGVNIQV